MREAFGKVFGDRMAEHPIDHTRAEDQSGRFRSSAYDLDRRDTTRGAGGRARAGFDRASQEFRGHMHAAWERMEDTP